MSVKKIKKEDCMADLTVEPGYIKHKFLNQIGCEDYIGFNDVREKRNIKRWRSYKTYENKNGVFIPDCWALDHAMTRYLYEHLMQYKKDAGEVVDLTFHKFTYKEKEYTQIELIDKLIELCEYVLMDLDSISKRSAAYKRLSENPYYKEYGEYWQAEWDHPEIEKEIWEIWATIFPSMWW